jgi:hypothetical protein
MLILQKLKLTEYVGVKSTAADSSSNGVGGCVRTRSCIGVNSLLAGVTNSKLTRVSTSVADGMVGM